MTFLPKTILATTTCLGFAASVANTLPLQTERTAVWVTVSRVEAPPADPNQAHDFGAPAKAVSEYAQRVNDALLGKGAQQPGPTVLAATVKSPKQWACSEFEPLWQGRGAARTCEWR